MVATLDNNACVECDQVESSDMVQCDKCDRWTHNSCAGLNEEVTSKKVRKFYCTQCQDEFGLIHDWQKKDDLIMEEKLDKMNYYEVDKIIGHKITTSGRKFSIKWKHYPETYLLPEGNFDGCIDLLQDYCIKKKLPLSNIEGLLGASSKAKFNYSNWKTMDEIVDAIATYRKFSSYRASQLPVLKYKERFDIEGIYLLANNFHCFVILFLHNQEYYIADGNNKVWDDDDRPLLKYRYVGQSKADFCASSAVTIALEFMRVHQGNRLGKGDNVLMASKWLRTRIVKLMHKFESASTSQKSAIADVRYYNHCISCGRKWRKNDRRILSLHERFHCPAKPKESDSTEEEDSATEIEDEDEA